jgi:hypothetical protein
MTCSEVSPLPRKHVKSTNREVVLPSGTGGSPPPSGAKGPPEVETRLLWLITCALSRFPVPLKVSFSLSSLLISRSPGSLSSPRPQRGGERGNTRKDRGRGAAIETLEARSHVWVARGRRGWRGVSHLPVPYAPARRRLPSSGSISIVLSLSSPHHRQQTMKQILLGLASLLVGALAIDTVPSLDVNAYLGRWYQGKRLPADQSASPIAWSNQ